MKLSILAIMVSLIVLAVGSFIMITSIYRSPQFFLGLDVFLVGLACTGFALWVMAVFGESSFFRRRLRPTPGSAP